MPLDPHCGRTASFGASRAALRSLGRTASHPVKRRDPAFLGAEGPRMARQVTATDGSTAVAPVALAGSCDRSREPDDHEGRRTLGLCPKWHMDVPRPFVKTGRRPEGWDIGPGCGGPVRADASTGHGGPVRSRRIYRSRRPLRSRRFTRGKRPHRESSIGESTLQPGTTTGPARRLRLEPPTSAGFRNGNKKSPACAGLRVWRGGRETRQ